MYDSVFECRWRPCDGLIPDQGVLSTVYRITKLKEKAAMAQQRAVEPLMSEMNG
jgi:hypothetical protein